MKKWAATKDGCGGPGTGGTDDLHPVLVMTEPISMDDSSPLWASSHRDEPEAGWEPSPGLGNGAAGMRVKPGEEIQDFKVVEQLAHSA